MFEAMNAVKIHISLDEIEPEVWRRLLLPSSWNLEQLHLAVQAAFNWWNYHLHEFRIGGLRYGDVEGAEAIVFDDDDARVFSSREVRLRDFEVGATFGYLYDFGDSWEHTIVIEEFVSLDVAPAHGSCIGGAGARPPEDVGGVPGYERFLEIMSDKADPEHADMKKWCGGHFDPQWFDLAVADKDVRNALSPNVKRQMHQPKPKRGRSR